MSISKKHFEAIARAIASERTAVTVREQTRTGVALAIAREMKQFNSNFDATRFLRACGVNPCSNYPTTSNEPASASQEQASLPETQPGTTKSRASRKRLAATPTPPTASKPPAEPPAPHLNGASLMKN